MPLSSRALSSRRFQALHPIFPGGVIAVTIGRFQDQKITGWRRIRVGQDGGCCGIPDPRRRSRCTGFVGVAATGTVNRMKHEPKMCPALYRVKVIPFLREKVSWSSKPHERSSMAASSFRVCPALLPVNERAS